VWQPRPSHEAVSAPRILEDVVDEVVELSSYAELVDVTGGHPTVRYLLSPDKLRRAWAYRRADQGSATTAAWVFDGPRWGPTIIAIGSPVEAARTVAVARRAMPEVGHVTVPAGTLELLPFEIGEGNDWDWFWTTSTPERRPNEVLVQDLDVTDPAVFADVAALLDIGAPGASTRPGDERGASWTGIPAVALNDNAGGGLAACLAWQWRSPGVSHLSSITTHPEYRGRGLASDLTAEIVRRHLAEGARAVTLGMYADNDTARRVYEKLGFSVGQAFSSRELIAPAPG